MRNSKQSWQQVRVLERLDAGLPMTRGQRFRLNIGTAGRALVKKDRRALWFAVKGMLRALFQCGCDP